MTDEESLCVATRGCCTTITSGTAHALSKTGGDVLNALGRRSARGTGTGTDIEERYDTYPEREQEEQDLSCISTRVGRIVRWTYSPDELALNHGNTHQRDGDGKRINATHAHRDEVELDVRKQSFD